MFFENSAKRLSHEILVKIIREFKDNNLLENADRIPLELRPLHGKTSRCCVYKSRALIKYRAMALLGFDAGDEKDELTPLSQYAADAFNRKEPVNKVLCIIESACSGCSQPRFYISDACRGCMARPCIENCPKKCISQSDGRAYIDEKACIMCGKCQTVCPYHAIIRVSAPCEDSCPVGAIHKDINGKANIDFEKCIYCGKCVDDCPFGAVTECSQIIDIMRALNSEKKVYALPAPAIAGQFAAGLEKINSALAEIGFYDIVEVAHGADEVAKAEAEEFYKKKAEGIKFMTTSCCPAYVQAARKVIPLILPHISGTPSPLQMTAKKLRTSIGDGIIVFIGPCVAKRKEALDDTEVDYYMTFAELAAIFEACDVKMETLQERAISNPALREGRGFAISGGVAAGILCHCREEDIKIESINGLSKAALRQLESYAKGAPSAELIEVMNCTGGCINGPATIVPFATAKKRLDNITAQSKSAKEKIS